MENIKEWERYKTDLVKWNKQRKAVEVLNKKLIKQWDSVPWWKFWGKLSFETKLDIILDNWRKLPPAPSEPMPRDILI